MNNLNGKTSKPKQSEIAPELMQAVKTALGDYVDDMVIIANVGDARAEVSGVVLEDEAVEFFEIPPGSVYGLMALKATHPKAGIFFARPKASDLPTKIFGDKSVLVGKLLEMVKAAHQEARVIYLQTGEPGDPLQMARNFMEAHTELTHFLFVNGFIDEAVAATMLKVDVGAYRHIYGLWAKGGER